MNEHTSTPENSPPSIATTLHANCEGSAAQLNRNCFCTTLNREALNDLLNTDDLNQNLLSSHPQLFSNTAVFISPTQLQQMRDIIQAVTRTVHLSAYLEEALSHATEMAKHNPGTEGVFMGYDFHLSDEGPKIIEINTNAGGAFLNAELVNAQTECCRAMGMQLPQLKGHLNETFFSMFFKEWTLQRGNLPINRIAIVDENPTEQFLYPEFKMARRLFEAHGIDTVIASPTELCWKNNRLYFQGNAIDLVYNRLTDFSLSGDATSALRNSYQNNAVVITPNPYHHAVYANKRNLCLLSNEALLMKMGVNKVDIDTLVFGIPSTRQVTNENANELWRNRKQYFFKPAAGFGSRATYRGDKLTTRVWEDILQGDYVAQQLIKPSERGILIDEKEETLKLDIRAYVYAGEIQLLAARLYQGQTTNFRTQGGGFAPVFVIQ